jgi:hypothetical protein
MRPTLPEVLPEIVAHIPKGDHELAHQVLSVPTLRATDEPLEDIPTPSLLERATLPSPNPRLGSEPSARQARVAMGRRLDRCPLCS